MMRASFDPPARARKKTVGIGLFLLVLVGWAAVLLVAGDLRVSAINPEPFLRIGQGNYAEATPSLFYTAFIGVIYGIGANIAGAAGIGAGVAAGTAASGILAFSLVQALLLAFICARAGLWLYAKGAPLWLSVVLVALSAMLGPFVRATVQPSPDVLVVACLFLLTLALIDDVENNCDRLHRAIPVCRLCALLTVMLFLSLSMAAVVVVTLAAICLTPTRIKLRLLLFALATLVVCLAVLFLALPSLGWTESPLAYFKEFSFPAFNIAYLAALVATLVALAGVLLNRRPRYLLPFVPLIAFGASAFFLQPPQAIDPWLYNCAFILCLPFLISMPLMREYRETKQELRERFLAARAAIPDEDRNKRSEIACLTLLRELKSQVDPADGYIGLYSAKGDELSLGRLAVRLGAFGYRTAYPARMPNAQLEFFTTLGVSDEALLDVLLGRNPFEAQSEESLEGMTRVEISEISALVVPGIVFDKDRHRIGQGDGYYDRYIVELDREIPVWGIGFQEQLTDSIPVEDHDQALSGIVVA
jgi:5-formyltetrahydrofolate cyclo-ligase